MGNEDKPKMPGHDPHYSGGTPLAIVAAVNEESMKVDMIFSQPIERVGLSPQDAINYAQALVYGAEKIIRMKKQKEQKDQNKTGLDDPCQN